MKYNECQMKMKKKNSGTYYYTNNNRTFNGSLRIQVFPDDPPCDGT